MTLLLYDIFPPRTMSESEAKRYVDSAFADAFKVAYREALAKFKQSQTEAAK